MAHSVSAMADSALEIDVPALMQQAEQKQLADQSVWQHLLLYRQKQEVQTAGFYLSQDKPFSPKKELEQTLRYAHDNPQAFCKYPARYVWLASQLSGFDLSSTVCKGLPDPTQDLRLILVSSYLKNPASTFGHVLVRTGVNDQQSLLDQSYSFGAHVPRQENGVIYVFKGLFGFYDAGFAKTEFFKQDMVYSKHEQRDMWEYIINLTDEQKELINYHLYELQHLDFDYYFLKQNCAYRSGELLELVSDLAMTERLSPWYAPDYIFHQLTESQAQAHLIRSVRYIPSDQNKIYQQFSAFSPEVQAALNQTIFHQQIDLLQQYPEDQRIALVNFLILYINYKDPDEQNAALKNFKKNLIKARFQLPVEDAEPVQMIGDRPSPATGPKPSQLSLYVAEDQQQLGVALFSREMLNTHTALDAEFKMMNMVAEIDHDAVKLDHIDFLKMLKIEDLSQPLIGERHWSWELATGLQTDAFNDRRYQPYILAGIGGGYRWNEYLIGYGLLDAELNDSHQKIDGILHAGMVYKKNQFAVQIDHQTRKRDSLAAKSLTQTTLKYDLAKNADVRLILKSRDVGMSYQYYW